MSRAKQPAAKQARSRRWVKTWQEIEGVASCGEVVLQMMAEIFGSSGPNESMSRAAAWVASETAVSPAAIQ